MADPAARPGWPLVLVAAATILVATGIAVSTLWPVFQSPAFIIAAAGSAAVGIAIATLGAFFRFSALVVMAITIGAYLVIGVPLGVPSETYFGVLPTPQGYLDLLTGTALSWKQLLTIVTPVGSYQALLVPVVILVLGASVIGMTIALRVGRAELAAIPSLVLFLVAILLGPTTAGAPVETSLCLGIVLVLWALWVNRRRRAQAIERVTARGPRFRERAVRRRIAGMRTVLGAAVVIAVAVAGGTVAAVAYPGTAARDVLRRHAVQPFDPRDHPSPLSAFRSYLQPDAADRAMLTVSGLPEGGRIRIAALDTYDGIVYSVGSAEVSSASGSFTRLPYRIDQSAVDGDPRTIDVRIGAYSGVWVPGVGRLSSIRFTSGNTSRLTDTFFYNDNSATGAVLEGLTSGDGYRSEAVVPRPVDAITALRPGTAVLPPVGLMPNGVAEALAGWVDPADPPGKQLADMIRGMTEDGYVSHGISDAEPPSRSGHAADRIEQLVTEEPMLGDGEQYAVAAALMARMIGFPARVVVGFAPRIESTSGSVTITGSDIAAWIEVQDASGSWVAVDPNPAPREVPDKAPDEPNVVSRPQVVLPPPPDEPRENDPPAEPQQVPDDPEQGLDAVLAALLMIARITGGILLAAAVVASPFLAIIAAKWRRRRLRRSAASPVAQIAGGWREFSDLAVDRGFPLTADATRAESAAIVGGARSLVLAGDVDRAVFAPGAPTGDDAEKVWTEVDALRLALDAGLTRRQRLLAHVSLRSFRQRIGAGKDRS